MVFKNYDKHSIIKYYILVIINMLLSGYFTTFIVNILEINATPAKVIADVIIFIINFYIQGKFIFVNKTKSGKFSK